MPPLCDGDSALKIKSKVSSAVRMHLGSWKAANQMLHGYIRGPKQTASREELET